jgi:TorA maturation chaperone TorD
MTPDPFDLARSHVYGFLAAALSDPFGGHFDLALDARLQKVAVAAGQLLCSEAPEGVALAPGERPPAELDLAPVVQALSVSRDGLVRLHQQVFGLALGKSAPPCETEYCPAALTFYRAQQLADIAGFYRAFALELNREQPERHDHISVELEFMAHLITKELAAKQGGLTEQAAVCREAQKKFFQDHIAWWVPAFGQLLRRAAVDGLYSALALALGPFIAGERAVLDVPPAAGLAEPRPETQSPEDSPCCEVAACPIRL